MKIILAAIFSLSASFCMSQSKSPIDTATSGLSFLQHFYTIYITDIAIGPDPHNSDSLVRKYATPGLLKKITAHSDPEKKDWWDYDPFIKAQDSDTAILKTLSVRMNKKESNWYSVSYKWTDSNSKTTTRTTIHLIVVKQKDGFKIADVW